MLLTTYLMFQRCHTQFIDNSLRFCFLRKFAFFHHFPLQIRQNLLLILLHNTVVYKNNKKWGTLVDTILSCSGSLVIFRCPRSITKTLLALSTWQNKVCSITCKYLKSSEKHSLVKKIKTWALDYQSIALNEWKC